MQYGLQKLTLLDFPGHVACTLFTKGCNFRCPFCHNASLVVTPDGEGLGLEEIVKFLQTRRGILDGVCITGGEPTLDRDLPNLLKAGKDLGFQMKLDTNGTNPKLLKQLIADHLVDYVAMDIKNAPDAYAKTVGVPNFDLAPIEESVAVLKNSGIPFEFRTTVVKELHGEEEMLALAKWIAGDEAYFLQQFVDSGDLISPGMSGCNKEEMLHLKEIVAPYLPKVEIRGV